MVSHEHSPGVVAPLPTDTPRAKAKVALRFEDVTQDGRLVLESLPTALGPAVFHSLLRDDAGQRACAANGVLPIVSRIVMEGRPGPFSPNQRVEAEGTYRVATAGDGRLMLDMWAELYAPLARVHDAAPPPDAPRVLAGRVLAEHVYTRPFAPAGKRRVASFDFSGAPDVRASRDPPLAGEEIAALPPSATPLEAAPRPDSAPTTFGLCHTDGNMHVNSLAYLHVFEEAALRRFAEIGRGSLVLARTLDIAYRKPCFAGQRMRVVQQAYEERGRLGVVSVLVQDEPAASEARPHVFVRMGFE